MQLFHHVGSFLTERIFYADNGCDFSAYGEIQVRILLWQVSENTLVRRSALLVLDNEMVTSDEYALILHHT